MTAFPDGASAAIELQLTRGAILHRSPLTHSALPAAVFVLATQNLRWVHAATGLSLGIASHLLWDTVDYGNLVGIPGGDADRIFLLSNAALLVIAAIWMTRRRPLATRDDKLVDQDAPLIPPGVVEEAMRIAAQEVIEEEERKFANRKLVNIDQLSYITIFFCSVLLIGYFVAVAISNS